MKRRLQRSGLAGMSESEQDEKGVCIEGGLAQGSGPRRWGKHAHREVAWGGLSEPIEWGRMCAWGQPGSWCQNPRRQRSVHTSGSAVAWVIRAQGSIRWACPWELLTKGGQSQTGKGGYPHVGGGRNQNMKLFT